MSSAFREKSCRPQYLRAHAAPLCPSRGKTSKSLTARGANSVTLETGNYFPAAAGEIFHTPLAFQRRAGALRNREKKGRRKKNDEGENAARRENSPLRRIVDDERTRRDVPRISLCAVGDGRRDKKKGGGKKKELAREACPRGAGEEVKGADGGKKARRNDGDEGRRR